MASPAAAIAFLRYMTSEERKDMIQGPKYFEAVALRGLRDFRAERGRLQCAMEVSLEKQNRMGNLHGGCIATLIDVVGTGALLTVSPRGGVSLNINVNYLDSMPGTKKPEEPRMVIIDARVLRLGRTIGTIAIDLHDQENGRLVASGVHVKYISSKEADISRLGSMISEGEVVEPPLPIKNIEHWNRDSNSVKALDVGNAFIRSRL